MPTAHPRITVKKTRTAQPSEWLGNGFGTVAATAEYGVSLDGVLIAKIDGGSFGYMESPYWMARSVIDRGRVISGKSFRDLVAKLDVAQAEWLGGRRDFRPGCEPEQKGG